MTTTRIRLHARYGCCALLAATALLLGNAGAVAAAGDSAFATPERRVCDDEAYAVTLAPVATGAALEARAVWLDARRLRWPGAVTAARYRLHHAVRPGIAAHVGAPVTGSDGALLLHESSERLSPEIAARFRYLGDGITLELSSRDYARIDELLRGELVLVAEDESGHVLAATRTQHAAALDARYAAAEAVADLGVHAGPRATAFALWTPTARAAWACLYRSNKENADALWPLHRDDATGVWRAQRQRDRRGGYYTFLVDVYVPGTGLVRNRVTDPYAISLNTDSRLSYIGDLDSPALKPPGWDHASRPPPLRAATDMTIYELHVRDFSVNDSSVPVAHRGNYLAFTDTTSDGMRHLRALAEAGLTDIHLLPVFDFATVPELGCVIPSAPGSRDSETQQRLIVGEQDFDCYNWGYDPWHFTAPEGSYTFKPYDGAARVREFRAMVQSLHAAGLRVGMDVVYNHTSAAGQSRKSVLDRIVPGYYQRLDAAGQVETSTCCANTATEHRMMAKLMIDSTVVWARDYAIDSFRFDLMGHQPRDVMERLRAAVATAAGREIQVIGEGWNFGEVADGARFVQASQLSLAGSGIGTFSDRARDAVRGGSPADDDARLVRLQGYVNGLAYDRNAEADPALGDDELRRLADLVRVGLAGTLRDYRMQDRHGVTLPLARIDYADQPAGYAAEPAEVVNYVENHDNLTLFDNNVFKLPLATTAAERARVQVLAAAIVAFSQGIAYYHAGIDLLRSKSLDRNSYDSGDWFNRLDWRGESNYFGSGLPPARDNKKSWPLMRPRLADPKIAPGPAEIAWTRAAFRDLLRIRASSTLFRMRTAADIRARLQFVNTGPEQVATVVAAHLDGVGYEGAAFGAIVYFINVDVVPRTLVVPQARGKAFVLHPAHRAAAAADRRPVEAATFERSEGRFTIPARTALVYVIDPVR